MSPDIKKRTKLEKNQMPIWTPVSKRLPLSVGCYLVYYQDVKTMTVNFFDGKNFNDHTMVSDPTHWMPLPKPPKVKK